MISRSCVATAARFPRETARRLLASCTLGIATLACPLAVSGQIPVETERDARGIKAGDIWIVSLGDSFSSGEGNPNNIGAPFNAWKWMDDEKCHRSKYGWPYLVAERAAARHSKPVYLTFLACSGAKLREGLLEPFTVRGVNRSPQLDRLARLIQAAGRVPDAVLMTGGGNDLGFADIVTECVTPGNCPGGQHTRLLARRMGELSGPDGLFARVAERLEEMGVSSDRVFLSVYPNPLLGRKRRIGGGWGPSQILAACHQGAGERMWTWASDNVVIPLQRLQRDVASAHGWRLVNSHNDDFLKHSYCPREGLPGADSWWVGLFPVGIIRQWGIGAFHPNRRGHDAMADAAFPAVQTALSADVSRDRPAAASSEPRCPRGGSFGEKFREMTDAGYRMVDVEGYTEGGCASYAGIWVKNTDNLPWRERRDLTGDGYGRWFTEMRTAGYRPVDIEAYTRNGQLNYAGIWVQNRENVEWRSSRNLSSDAFGRRFQELSRGGYRLIDVEAYASGNQTLYADIWVKNTDNLPWREYRNLTLDGRILAPAGPRLASASRAPGDKPPRHQARRR